jgi:predicted Zn-dependent protease with MMP-like domain
MPTPKEINHAKLLKMARVEVDAAIWELPSDVRAILERVPVFLERRPEADDIAAGIDADTLGIFEEGAGAAASPTPRIRLWLENLWEMAEGDLGNYRAEVRTTLLHEIGHVLGWDEEDLEERGLD